MSVIDHVVSKNDKTSTLQVLLICGHAMMNKIE